mmetsp:Transcript_10622/g.14016  ORF Transcript_10622/g.14016 Transcript_10622/m.14016 type:complete len:80 (-) Transcript_10622:80-319(-)|eukprot:CAMPEP_0185774118 /NCGR_PEP_ID=MMETSP1174-20130828/76823_1 /TAXON_ID=35687 /ORGANISM="Dictyocha speculum, Strain CCMP1381" /LENGTH=79 /DNA_ID=CAMNT_0028461131 /DNA_START=212 /DNA_END=451 /DNA_ORIENTATION=-
MNAYAMQSIRGGRILGELNDTGRLGTEVEVGSDKNMIGGLFRGRKAGKMRNIRHRRKLLYSADLPLVGEEEVIESSLER